MSALPDELTSSPRARPRWAVSPIFPLVAVAILFVMAFTMGIVAWRLHAGAQAGEGPPAGTAVIDTAVVVHQGKSSHGRVTFSHGDVISSCDVSSSDVSRLKPGDHQSYWVVDGGEEIATCAATSRRQAVFAFLFVPLVVISFGVGVWIAIRARRTLRTYTHGEAAIARLTTVRPRLKYGGFFVGFTFEVPGGSTPIVAKGVLERGLLRQSACEQPAPEQELFVVYDPKRPKKALAWGLGPMPGG